MWSPRLIFPRKPIIIFPRTLKAPRGFLPLTAALQAGRSLSTLHHCRACSSCSGARQTLFWVPRKKASGYLQFLKGSRNINLDTIAESKMYPQWKSWAKESETLWSTILPLADSREATLLAQGDIRVISSDCAWHSAVEARVSFLGLLGIKECGFVMCNVSTLPLHRYTQQTPGQVSHYECSHTSVGVWGQSPSRVTLWVSWHIRDRHTAFVSHHSRHNSPSALSPKSQASGHMFS